MANEVHMQFYKKKIVIRQINVAIYEIKRTKKIITIYEGCFKKTKTNRKYYYKKLLKYRRQLENQEVNFRLRFQKKED